MGNQKSGTTAIAGLLARMTELSVTLDLRREIDAPTFPRVHAGEWSMARFIRRNRLDFSRAIIKEPNLTLLCAPLREYFPDARFVFIVRDPRDGIRSILDRFVLPGHLDELTAEQWSGLSPAWRLVFDGRWLGLTAYHYVERLAQRWALCANVYLHDVNRFVLCRYEDFERDKLGTLGQLAHELKLSTARDVTDGLEHDFQPRGANRHVRVEQFFGSNLDRITRVCEPAMQAFGYAVPTPGS